MTTLTDTAPVNIPAKPKRQKPKTTRPVEVLTREEIDKLLRACSDTAKTGVRNRALIVVLWRAGLRISEALALTPKDLNRQAGTIRILHGKGNKARTVGADATTFTVIARWLDLRASLGIGGRAPVFCTLKGEPIDSSYIRQLLPRLAEEAGVEKRVHAHALRHTHAAELAMEGTPMNLIQCQMGHENLSTTSKYLNHISPHQLIEAMQRRTWKSDLFESPARKDGQPCRGNV